MHTRRKVSAWEKRQSPNRQWRLTPPYKVRATRARAPRFITTARLSLRPSNLTLPELLLCVRVFACNQCRLTWRPCVIVNVSALRERRSSVAWLETRFYFCIDKRITVYGFLKRIVFVRIIFWLRLYFEIENIVITLNRNNFILFKLTFLVENNEGNKE